MALNQDQKQRYARQILLPEIGISGQEKLGSARVLVIGLGGLGSAASFYLAAAGVGHLGLADNDRVELSNLQRQILHTTNDLGIAKTDSAARRLGALNPEIGLELIPRVLDQASLAPLVSRYDFILDATDNFSSKFIINDVCVTHQRPFNHAGVRGFSGQIFTYVPGREDACLRCLFQQPPPQDKLPDKAQAGILGAVAGVLGTLQACEAIKYLTNTGRLLENRVLIMDALDMKVREVRFQPAADCPVCSPLRSKQRGTHRAGEQ